MRVWRTRSLDLENVFRVSALSVFLMFFLVLILFREPKREAGEPAPSIARTVKNFGQVIVESEVHVVSVDFHGLLDRVLAAVHHPAGIRA